MKNSIFKANNKHRIKILFLCDLSLAFISFYLSIFLRLDNIFPLDFLSTHKVHLITIPISVAIAIYLSGSHRIVIRHFDNKNFLVLILQSLIVSLSFYLVANFIFLHIPRSIPIIFSILYFLLLLSSRYIYQELFIIFNQQSKNRKKNIVIYGSGSAGINIFNLFRDSDEFDIKCFIDDDISLNNRSIHNLKILSRKNYIESYKDIKVDEVWISMPSTDSERIKNCIKFSENIANTVKSLPRLTELFVKGDIKDKLVEVKADDLLGRDKIDVSYKKNNSHYYQENILVTGGGGSIGSELCMQVIEFEPKLLVLLEISELALYNTKELLSKVDQSKTKLIFCLGSVNDQVLVNKILSDNQINIVLHAAAYKHVLIVENNIMEGLKNNFIGTLSLIKCSIKNNISRFVLVSTDKAVNPSNIMGLSKRLSELVVQYYSLENKDINFAIVRFGNVLGSSGSVIPLFMKQIKNGGPVTVTDVGMTRYFMSISEASRLIITAGSFGNKGEIFVLDMGKPVRIIDLAKNMIKLSGLTVKDELNQDGDISIIETKAHPREKLNEDLFISKNIKKTDHPKVLVSDEHIINAEISVEDLIKIERDVINNNINEVNKFIRNYIN